MPNLRTPVCERLGIALPIFGFTHAADVAIAIAEAGGFPVFGVARERPDRIAHEIADLRTRLGDRPFGVDLMYPKLAGNEPDRDAARRRLPEEHVAFVESLRERYNVPAATRPNFFSSEIRNEALLQAQTEAVLESDANAVATAVGLPRTVIEAAKARGKTTFALVGSPRHVRPALDAGVDILVAHGYDAGGHTGPVGTFSLVPQIVQAAGGVPVLAAGGIGCGQQIASAFALGAQGAWLGTAWLAARENRTPHALLSKLLAAGSEDTVLTRAHSGKPCRVVRSEWIDAWNDQGSPQPLPMPLQQVLTGDVFTSIHENNNPQLIYEAAGQSVFAIEAETTISAQFDRLVADMDKAWDRLRSLAVG